MPWFIQILLQSLVVGVLVLLAAWLSWFPAKLAVGAALAYLVYYAARSPSLIFRRGFHLIVVAAVLPLGLTLRAEGAGATSQDLGYFRFLLDLGEAAPAWLWFGLAALCLAGDALVGWREATTRKRLYDTDTVEGELTGANEARTIRMNFSFRPRLEVELTGATLRLAGLFPQTLRTQLWVRTEFPGQSFQVGPGTPQTVGADKSAQLTVQAQLPAKPGLILRTRIRPFWARLLPLRALLTLKGDKIEPLPVKIAQPPGL
ncbi:MAG: hypothetical protein WBR13_13035 [Allosphingosinicella sp.]